MKVTPVLLLLLAAAACAPEVPAEPTWIDDVRPILAANCIRCHSPPYIGGVPNGFRLDQYENDIFVPDGDDVGTAPDEEVYGAAYESEIEALVTFTSDGRMPPRFPLTDRQLEVLVAWRAAEEPRGGPREGNALPSLTLVGDLNVISEGRVGFEYEIDDADGDIVTGQVIGDPGGGDSTTLASNELFVGRGSVRFSLAAGTYDLSAELDDGHGQVIVDLGQVVVP